MKWIFIAGLFLIIPIIAAILRQRPQYMAQACFLVGVLPFFLNFHLYVAPISWAYWSGIVKGIEISVLDALALGMLLASREQVRTPLPMKIFFCVYLLGLLISTFAGQQVIPALFYAWQLMRAVLVYLAVSRAVAVAPQAPIALVAGLGSAVLFECVVATWQYVHGSIQAGGTLGHRTMIGILSHSAVMPAFALVLGGSRRPWAVAVVVAGAVIAYVGASRATIGLYGIGLLITLILSLRHKMTGRKLALGVAALVTLAIAAPVMKFAIDRRSEEARVSSNEERHALIDAALMIIWEHPFGVGANQYVLVANVGGYSDRAGVSWFHESRSAPVHDSYLLVLAELGWIGLIGMVGFLACSIGVGWKSLRRLPGGERSELLVGVLAAIIISAIHSAFEWITMDFRMHYMLAIDLGLMIGILAAQARAARKSATGGKASTSSDGQLEPVTA
jgi:O-Antigen ligase